MLAESVRQRAHKEEKLRTEASATAEKLAAITVQVGAKVGESGKIFGSVNAIQIAEALRKAGVEVERKNITLDEESVKQIGTYTAHVKIYKDIKADVKFEVVAE
jgi:large subunit ribosomal protein L9